MKTLAYIFALWGLLAASPAFSVVVPTVVLNAESTFPGWSHTAANHLAYDKAYCWGMTSDIYYSSSSKISGTFSIRTIALNNAPPSWIVSPWLDPESGNLTLKAKLEGTKNVQSRKIEFWYIPYSASGVNYEGTPVLFYTYNWSSINTTLRSISVSMPAALVNSQNLFKIKLSFSGSGGNYGLILDDLVIPGFYMSDPTQCGANPMVTDTDGDGVMDTEDAYPNDAARAYNLYVPAAGNGTLFYEDLWPKVGDYDLNDAVVGYRHHIVTSASNKVVTLNSTYTLKAVGAALDNGFAFQLDGVAPSRITSVTGVDAQNPSWWTKAANGTETGQTSANVLVFDNARRVLPAPSGAEFSNTDLTEPYVQPVSYQVSVQFAAGQVDYGTGLSFNPYMILRQLRGLEVHLHGKAPSSKADADYFGTEDDATNPTAGVYYKSKDNLPWGLDIPKEIPYSREKVDIVNGYLKLAPWAQSNGVLYPDWYEPLPGYRDNTKLYIR